MAIIKAAKSGSSLGRIMNYVDKKAELTSGLNVSDDKQTAMFEMQQTKEMYNKTDGRQYKHYIQSFSPKDNDKLTPEKVHELGCEWANEHFQGFEVFIATHTDREHLHNHFVVNSVSFEDGHKFQVSSKQLHDMKVHSNSICEREGLFVPEKIPLRPGEVRTFNMDKYQLIKRVSEHQKIKSYVVDIALAVDKARVNSKSRDEFIKAMQEQGYSTKWQDNIKHVTFENQDGNKVRLNNLEKTFNNNSFTKEELENEFDRNQRNERTRGNNKAEISQGKATSSEPSNGVGSGEQLTQRTLDGITGQIRRIGERTSQFSVEGRANKKKHERELREQAAKLEQQLKADAIKQRNAKSKLPGTDQTIDWGRGH